MTTNLKHDWMSEVPMSSVTMASIWNSYNKGWIPDENMAEIMKAVVKSLKCPLSPRAEAYGCGLVIFYDYCRRNEIPANERPCLLRHRKNKGRRKRS
jgi:hypothetical protein